MGDGHVEEYKFNYVYGVPFVGFQPRTRKIIYSAKEGRTEVTDKNLPVEEMKELGSNIVKKLGVRKARVDFYFDGEQYCVNEITVQAYFPEVYFPRFESGNDDIDMKKLKMQIEIETTTEKRANILRQQGISKNKIDIFLEGQSKNFLWSILKRKVRQTIMEYYMAIDHLAYLESDLISILPFAKIKGFFNDDWNGTESFKKAFKNVEKLPPDMIHQAISSNSYNMQVLATKMFVEFLKELKRSEKNEERVFNLTKAIAVVWEMLDKTRDCTEYTFYYTDEKQKYAELTNIKMEQVLQKIIYSARDNVLVAGEQIISRDILYKIYKNTLDLDFGLLETFLLRVARSKKESRFTEMIKKIVEIKLQIGPFSAIPSFKEPFLKHILYFVMTIYFDKRNTKVKTDGFVEEGIQMWKYEQLAKKQYEEEVFKAEMGKN